MALSHAASTIASWVRTEYAVARQGRTTSSAATARPNTTRRRTPVRTCTSLNEASPVPGAFPGDRVKSVVRDSDRVLDRLGQCPSVEHRNAERAGCKGRGTLRSVLLPDGRGLRGVLRHAHAAAIERGRRAESE